MAWLFGSLAKAEIILEDVEGREIVNIPTEKGIQQLYVYHGADPVKGRIQLKLGKGVKKIEHQGIRVDFIGQIELFYDRGSHFQFLSLTKPIAQPGEIRADQVFDFEFLSDNKTHESYNGKNAILRYFVKFVMIRSFAPNITAEQDIWVINYDNAPDVDKPIKMEVGIEKCLHIEFEYMKSKYHLRDVVIGKVYFLLVRLKIKYMELALHKRETTGTGPNTFSEDEKLTKFEIMDGVPVRGESIPVRLFLGSFDLTPTYRNVHSKFSVKYLLNLVLVDDQDRRYFKQQEIILWRKKPGTLQDMDKGNHNARLSGTKLDLEFKAQMEKEEEEDDE